MNDIFDKLLHALCSVPFSNTMELTVALEAIKSGGRFFLNGVGL